jgi:predicted RNA binding protein YcfA (HicA-like mRNA interferase family)
MKAYSSREVIKILKEDGWILKGIEGSHHNFTHPTKNYKIKTLKSIFEQAGLAIE